MTRRGGRTRGAVLGLLVAGLLGCGPAEPAEEATAVAATASRPATRTYQVRGIIDALPGPQTGPSTLFIRHEAIPDLVGPSGEIDGMAAMTMPFAVSPDLDLGGLTPGDKVLFRLEVDWEESRPVMVSAIHRLGPEIELELD